MSLFERPVVCADRDALKQMAASLAPGQSAYFCNVHMLMHSRRDPRLAKAMNAADFVFPDGAPVAWLQRRLGRKEAGVLRGYEAMELICRQAVKSGKSIGLFGASDSVLAALRKTLEERHPGLAISYVHAPPMIEEDASADPETIDAINAADPDYLFVGLGCPKQEKWIFRHREHLHCAMLGVGAAFGWLAGTTPKPPRWMEETGLGWLFRLLTQPRHTAKRYFVYNTRFIFASSKLLLSRPKSSVDPRDR